MQRPYYDSYSYRFAESQIENERLRREVRDLSHQVNNLKWYNTDLKNSGTKESLKVAELTRFQESKINDLEFLASDLRSSLYDTQRQRNLETKKLNEELNRSQSRLNNLEWLNNELKKEKSNVAKDNSELRYTNATLSTENYRKQRALEEEKKRASLLESRVSLLNTTVYEKELETKEKERKIADLKFKNTSLNSSLYSKDLQLRSTTEKVVDLEKKTSNLLTENYSTRKELEKERLEKSSLQLQNNSLNRSLDIEKRTAHNLREQNSTLLSETLVQSRKLRKNEELFKSIYDEQAAALDATRRSFITAEKNLELSRMDPDTYEYSYLDRKYESLKHEQSVLEQERTLRDIKDKLNESKSKVAAGTTTAAAADDLNTSTAFTDYYENKYGKSSKLYEDIERDLRMYRIEQSLNDSLTRLRKWSQNS